jgi:DNA gyrase subunit A
MINIDPNDNVLAYINVLSLKDEDYIANNYIILCTKKGIIKKTSLEAYSRPRQNGINAITVREGDVLLEARLTNGNNEVIMALRSGRAIRFNESTVRPMGRNASGVRGITLANEKDEVVGMICVENIDSNILVVSEKGYGKRSDLNDYRITNRGGKGVKTLNVTDKTGELIAIKEVSDSDDLMIINKSGIIIRIGVESLRVMGRATQGVRLINLRANDEIAAVAKVSIEEEEEIDEIMDADVEITDETTADDETSTPQNND